MKTVLNQKFTLTKDQENAFNVVYGFLMSHDTAMVLKGYSGTGKSTWIKELVNRLPEMQRMVKLIDPNFKPMELVVTATTNKAADNLKSILAGTKVSTIYSKLGVRLKVDAMTGEEKLDFSEAGYLFCNLLLIDEASMLQQEMKDYITSSCKNHSKVIFIGDPDQLIAKEPSNVFTSQYTEAVLSEIVRNGSNPISEIGQQLRESVHTGVFKKIKLDGKHLIRVDGTTFNQLIEEEFANPNWKYRDSKILAKTNKRVTTFNSHLWNKTKKRNHFSTGDYVVNNSFLPQYKNYTSIKTDAVVKIHDSRESINGMDYSISSYHGGIRHVFVPNDFKLKEQMLSVYRAEENMLKVTEVMNTWADLRPMYSSTVHKAQGSTFNKVFIDLNDLKRYFNFYHFNDRSMFARLMYVATTRAREQVIFTGDL